MAWQFPDKVLASHTAVLGMTGAGKTSTTKLLVEQVVAAGRRVVVLDAIKSDWWGITSSASGKRAGLPFKILGGPHGHLPLPSSAGKAVGHLVATGKLPLSIVDMADFEPGGLQRFFVDFAQALWRDVKGVIYVVIEEAHEFAPKERAGFGHENMAIHWAKKLATGSRTKGIRLIVATQSVQQLHNRVLGGCATLVAHRISFDADQEPVLRWLKTTDKEMAAKVGPDLAVLPDGTGWVCNGVAKIFERVAFPKFKTYDNTATPDDDSPTAQVTTAPVDQTELRAIIGDAVKEAEAEDPKKLRAEIARLTKELAAAPKVLPAPPVDVLAIQEAANQRARAHVLGVVASFLAPLAEASGRLHENLAGALEDVHDLASKMPATPPALPAPKPKPPTLDQQWSRPPPRTDGHPAMGPERKPLAVLAGAYPAGMTEGQWALGARLRRTGGTWSTYLSRLRTAGRIEERGGLFYATEAGMDDIGVQAQPLPAPGVELVRYWSDKLRGKPAAMLLHLAEAFPMTVEREALASRVSLTESGGTFGTYLSRLRAPGLIEETGNLLRVSAALMVAA